MDAWILKVGMFLLTWIGLALIVGPVLGGLSTTGDGDDTIEPEDVIETLDRMERNDYVAREHGERRDN